MNFFTKIIEAIKLKPRHVLVAALFCAAVVFLPEEIITRLGIAALLKEYRAWFGFGLLFCVCHLLVHVGLWVNGLLKNYSRTRGMRKTLHRLTEEEKAVLRVYIDGKTITQKLHPMDGVVAQLVARQIIGQATIMGSLVGGWAYNINPWAWDYLNKKPQFLRPDENASTQRSSSTIDPTFD